MNDQLRDAAFRAGVWQFIEQRAKSMKDAAKAELSQLEPGDAVSGKWHGQPVAKATMTKGRTKLVVTDERKFLEWVAEFAPTEIVRSVNPAYMKQIEARAKSLGAPVNMDGELYPGLDLQEGDPYVSIRKADGAEDVIAELFRSGNVGLDGIKSAPLPPVVPELDALPVNRWTGRHGSRGNRMRDRGFGFTAANQADTVTVKIQCRWDRGAPIGSITDALTQAYAEAFQRATEAEK